MKFGVNLQEQMTPEWKSQYVSYETMKSMLYDGLEALPTYEKVSRTASLKFIHKIEEIFFHRCDKDLDKINTFFIKKVSEAEENLNSLKHQMKKAEKIIHRMNLTDSGNRKSMRFLEFEKLRKLKKSFEELHYSIVLLRKYQNLNCSGFRKILKKHDKLLKNTTGGDWYKAVVLQSNFVSYNNLDIQLAEVESIIMKDLKRVESTELMSDSKEKLGKVEVSHDLWRTFKMGLLFGVLLMLVISVVISLVLMGCSSEAWVVVQLFRAPFTIAFYLFLIGVNIYGWKRYGMNYILIFDINPREPHTRLSIINVSLIFGLLCVFSLLCFIHAPAYNIGTFYFPLLILLAMLIFFILATSFFEKSRFWMLRKLSRVFITPFLFVEFTDFWFGDQMNSLVQVLGDLEITMCFYTLGVVNWMVPNEKDLQQCSNSTRFTHITLLCLPAWFRFAQCIRRFWNTKQKFPHLANALKYGSSFFVVICTYFKGIHPQTAINVTWNPYLYAVIFSHSLNSLFTLWWDLIMDWGLFQMADRKSYNILRNELLYPKRIFYYFAILQNTLLRFSWIIPVLIEMKYVRQVPSYVVVTTISILEIIRRFIWNFIRMENEHLNNCGQFRAVRKISRAAVDEMEQDRIMKMMDDDDGVINRRIRSNLRRR